MALSLSVYLVGMNHTIITGEESTKWPETTGKVDEARVIVHTGNRTDSRGGSTTTHRYYEVIPQYRYSVGAAVFSNDKANAGGGFFFGNEADARHMADSLRSAHSVRVFYDPSNASNSVLERGIPERDFMGLLFAIPATGGVTGMTFNHFSKRKIPDAKRRRFLSIQLGMAAAVVAGIVQWLMFEALM